MAFGDALHDGIRLVVERGERRDEAIDFLSDFGRFLLRHFRVDGPWLLFGQLADDARDDAFDERGSEQLLFDPLEHDLVHGMEWAPKSVLADLGTALPGIAALVLGDTLGAPLRDVSDHRTTAMRAATEPGEKVTGTSTWSLRPATLHTKARLDGEPKLVVDDAKLRFGLA